jgi:hypothetical protein
MSPVAIPYWSAQGVLPPRNAVNPTSYDRSPYDVALTDVVLRYATTPERRTILDGFLGFREALDNAGIRQGFQWLDGSFLENIDRIESRPPRDVDVVTLYHLSQGMTQQDLLNAHPALFDQAQTKAAYHVDAYFVQINNFQAEPLIEETIYWYSLWSHRCNDLWKGYLQVDLAPTDNAAARANLTAMIPQGGSP